MVKKQVALGYPAATAATSASLQSLWARVTVHPPNPPPVMRDPYLDTASVKVCERLNKREHHSNSANYRLHQSRLFPHMSLKLAFSTYKHETKGIEQ